MHIRRSEDHELPGQQYVRPRCFYLLSWLLGSLASRLTGSTVSWILRTTCALTGRATATSPRAATSALAHPRESGVHSSILQPYAYEPASRFIALNALTMRGSSGPSGNEPVGGSVAFR